jgi:hypothetical protein
MQSWRDPALQAMHMAAMANHSLTEDYRLVKQIQILNDVLHFFLSELLLRLPVVQYQAQNGRVRME